ncbi:MAG: tetratricopeptide repeat protein [Acidobacteriota bacterium]
MSPLPALIYISRWPLLMLAVLSLNAYAQQPSARPLELGKTITVAAAQPSALPKQDLYLFSGVKGEYIEIRVQQQGCDVRLYILTPDNRPIAVFDSYNGAYGPEYWRGVLAQAGRYQVKVEQLSLRSGEAKYTITLAIKRSANDADRRRAQAQEFYGQAWQRRQGGSQLDFEESYYLYEDAMAIYRETADALGEAQSIESIAALGSPTLPARIRAGLYQDALALFRRLRERSGEATTLHNLGALYARSSRLQEAITFYEQAIIAYRAVPDQHGEAVALNNLALVYCELRQPQEALRYFQQALMACRQSGDRTNEVALLKYIGEVYEELGQPQQAERYYQQSEELKGK